MPKATTARALRATTAPVAAAYAEVAVLAADASGKILSCTDSLKELGLAVDGSPLGKPWDSLFDTPQETQVDAESGPQWSFFSVRGQPQQGYRVTRYPMLELGRGPAGFFYIIEKVTSAAANDRLLHYEKMFSLGEAVASVAHEVNNPLSIISGWLQLHLMEMPADSHYRESFLKMQEEAERIAQILSNLLRFARRHPPQTTSVDVNELIRELVSLVGYQFRNENISIITVLDPTAPFVKADRNRLKQVLWNLIINARQAMPQGGQLTLSSRAGPMVDLRVEDTGVGISPQVMKRIFEPFFTTKQDRGTGLGLSVSRSIVAAFSGTLDVESQEALGSTFIVRLPAVKGSEHGNA